MVTTERSRRIRYTDTYFCIRAYATASNSSFETGLVEVMYGGVRKTFLGHEGFEPYKTEESAKRGKSSWEKLFADLNTLDSAWKQQVGGIMPVNESMYREIESQRDRDNAIIRNIKDPVLYGLAENMEKAILRAEFKIVK